jgi:2,5-diamino-6-(ribosylamino)-4(3H)-pyrimidinone 5'-phosphate reductase
MPRPWISTNLAISADGKISSVERIPASWTSAADHDRLLELRKNADALMVGRGTWERDRMTMTAPQNPIRCIVSRAGRLDDSHPIFSKPGGPIHLLVTGDETGPAPDGVIVHRTDLTGFLHQLATNLGVKRLHCEGGGELIGSLAEIDAIDEFHMTWAGHRIFGGGLAPTPTGMPGKFLPSSRHFRLSAFSADPISGECYLSYLRKDN